MIDIKTSSDSVDVTTQSASSADNATTTANDATTEMQKQSGARQEELADRQAAKRAKLLYRLRELEEQLSVARARKDVEFDFLFYKVALEEQLFDFHAESWARSGAKDDKLSRFIATALQLETDKEVLETELSLARTRSSYTPAQNLLHTSTKDRSAGAAATGAAATAQENSTTMSSRRAAAIPSCVDMYHHFFTLPRPRHAALGTGARLCLHR